MAILEGINTNFTGNAYPTNVNNINANIPLPNFAFVPRKLEFSGLTLINLFQAGCIKIFKLFCIAINFLKSYFFPAKNNFTPPRVKLNPLSPKDAITILGIDISDLDKEPLKLIEGSYRFKTLEISKDPGAEQRLSIRLKAAFNKECTERSKRIERWVKAGNVQADLIKSEQEALEEAQKAHQTLLVILQKDLSHG